VGQLESLRELNIAEPNKKERRKENYTIVVHFDENFSEP
jgi:hypothetical protein